jgi:inosine-uridine nucleoside N-ribohydrolase
MNRPDIPLALSGARGWNAFPWPYRGDCVTFSATPSLQPYRSTVPTPPPSGDDLLIGLLEEAIASRQPLTVLITTAFTPLTDILSDRPGLAKGIGQVVWMGGPIDVPGNLDPAATNPAVANTHAEWNAFFDPFAVAYGLQNFPDINVFPLDITNSAAITGSLLDTLKAQGQTHAFSQLAYEAYRLVKDEPYYEMWNVCATCWLAVPNLYAPADAPPSRSCSGASSRDGCARPPRARRTICFSPSRTRPASIHMSRRNWRGPPSIAGGRGRALP